MNTVLHTQITLPVVARRWIGWAAIIAAVAAMIEVPLYFLVPTCPAVKCGTDAGSPMPDGVILSRTVFSMVALTALIVFFSGMRHLIARADARYEWFGAVAGTVGVAYATIDLVAKGIEGSMAIRATDWIDPTRVAPTQLLYGSIAHILLVVFAVTFGYAVLRTQALPRWVAWSSFVVAVVQLALIPSMFFGYDSSQFYASNGWGSVASFNGATLLWIGIVGISVLRRKDASLVLAA